MMGFPDIELDIDISEEEREWNARFPPLMVYVDAPYAKYIEYGTGPAKSGSAMSREYINKLEVWAQNKFGLSDKASHDIAYAVGMKIHNEGIKQHPFARPAMEDLIWDIDNGRFDFNDPTLTSWELAGVLIDRMRWYLSRSPGPSEYPRRYPIDYNTTHTLFNSMYIGEAPPWIQSTLSINIIEDMDDVVVRDSSTLGYHDPHGGALGNET